MEMTVKWGFGLEKETALMGYNKGFKNFDFVAKNSFVYTHDENDYPIGDYAWGTTDVTVYNPNANGYEFATKLKWVDDYPKKVIEGFNRDVERRIQTEKSGIYDVKRSLPFGSIPTFNTGSTGSRVPGSYHFNLTMPYDEDKIFSRDFDYIRQYRDDVKKGLLQVRLMQPFFLAMLGGTAKKAIGNPEYYEASVRQLYVSGTSGIGSTPLDDNSDLFRSIDSHTSSKKSDALSVKWRNNLNVSSATYRDMISKTYVPRIPTMEFRFIDVFDTRGVHSVFVALATIMANGKRGDRIRDARKNNSWNNMMEIIGKEGWNAYIPIKELRYLCKNLHIPNQFQGLKRVRADLVFNRVMNVIFDKNKQDVWVKSWIKDSNMPMVHNFNKSSWEFYFVYRMLEDEAFRKKIILLLQTIDKVDASASGGFIKVNWDGNKYGIRDIILDDKVVGKQYGAEDTEDILHALARYKLIGLKEMSDGRIDSITKLWSSKKELNKLFSQMLKEENMLNEDYPGLVGEEPDVEVSQSTPEPTPESTPEPSIPRGEPVSTSGEQIMADYRIVNVPSDSDQQYLLDDFKQVLSMCQFTRNGRPLSYNLNYSNSPKTLWKGRGQIINLYIPSTYQSLDLIDWAKKIKAEKMFMISTQTGALQQIFAQGIGELEFYDRIVQVTAREYTKNRQSQIQTTKAGIFRLKRAGIYIVSYNRGQKYMLYDTESLKQILSRFGERVKIINYIPNYKNYYIIGDHMKTQLLKNGRVVSQIQRGII